MYVVLERGGKQYRLKKDDEFIVDRCVGKESSIVKFKSILFAKEKNAYHVGTPHIKDAYVACEILSHPRAEKVVAYKYKRRKGYKRKVGHRQDVTRLRVKEIRIGG